MDDTRIIKALEEIEEEISKIRREMGKGEVSDSEQVVGTFDGEFMITSDAKKYQVPPNYASKSLLVPGDTLRLIEEGDRNMFKHIGKVDRVETEGVLVKRGEEWWVVCPQGEFKILAASIRHFEVDIGDSILLDLPKNYKETGAEWGAMKESMTEKPVSKLEMTAPPTATESAPELVPEPVGEDDVKDEEEDELELR